MAPTVGFGSATSTTNCVYRWPSVERVTAFSPLPTTSQIAQSLLERSEAPRVQLLEDAQHCRRFQHTTAVNSEQWNDLCVPRAGERIGLVRQLRGFLVSDGTGPARHFLALRRLMPAAAAVSSLFFCMRFCLSSLTCPSDTVGPPERPTPRQDDSDRQKSLSSFSRRSITPSAWKPCESRRLARL